MTAGGISAWVDPDGDGTATPTLNSSGSGASIGTALPLINGSASAGAASTASAVDHVHPTDTTRAALASPVFSGTPTLPTGTTGTTQSAADGSTKIATTAYVDTADALKANLAGPTFTGAPVLPTGTTGTTQAANDASTKLSTTGYVDNARYRTGIPYLSGYTYDPRAGMSVTAWPFASRGFFVRPQGVKKTGCTSIYIAPGASSGSVSVAVYASTGSGTAAVPTGNALSAGSAACPTGNQISAITIAAQDIDPELHWLYLMVDNTSATLAKVALANDSMGWGILRSFTGTAVSVPVNGFTISANATYLPWIGYG